LIESHVESVVMRQRVVWKTKWPVGRLICAALWLGQTTSLEAQRMSDVLRGTVRAQSGRPIAGARVEEGGASDNASAMAPAVLTDSAGRFRLVVTGARRRFDLAGATAPRPSTPRTAGGPRLAVTLTLYLRRSPIVASAERPLPARKTPPLAVRSCRADGAPDRCAQLVALLLTCRASRRRPALAMCAVSFNAQNSLYTSYLLDE
jgi:hypothetical protein